MTIYAKISVRLSVCFIFFLQINHIINIDQLEIKDHLVILNDVELSLNEISFLTDSLETQVLTKKKEDDYYWNTSINNASILKL